MSILRASLALLVVLSFPARADVLGIHAGVGFWSYDLEGEILGSVQLDRDLNVFDEQGVTAYAALEHPIPVIPNSRVQYSDIATRNIATLQTDFEFRGFPFTVGATEDVTFDMTHIDATLYYEIVDIGMDIDVGATLRVFQGDVTIGPVTEEVVTYLPAVYARAKFGLPFSGLYLGGNVNAGGVFTDYEVTVGWETENFIFPEFGVALGYRSLSIDGDASDIDLQTDVTIDGAFITLTGHF